MNKTWLTVFTAVVLGLLAAGCGSTHSSDVATVSPDSRHLHPASASQAADALRASRCMRSHGVPNFPNPILGGHFGFMASSGIDPETPQFKAAYRYCGTRYLHLHPPTPAELARRNTEAVKFSACMRSHGAPDFPDPDGQGAIHLATPDYINTPNVQRAEGACKSLQAGKGFILIVPVPVR